MNGFQTIKSSINLISQAENIANIEKVLADGAYDTR